MDQAFAPSRPSEAPWRDGDGPGQHACQQGAGGGRRKLCGLAALRPAGRERGRAPPLLACPTRPTPPFRPSPSSLRSCFCAARAPLRSSRSSASLPSACGWSHRRVAQNRWASPPSGEASVGLKGRAAPAAQSSGAGASLPPGSSDVHHKNQRALCSASGATSRAEARGLVRGLSQSLHPQSSPAKRGRTLRRW